MSNSMKSLIKLSQLTAADNSDVFKRSTKLGEEYGEFCAALLEEDGFKVSKVKKTKDELREHVLEEGIDTIIMTLDILRHQGFGWNEMSDMLEVKLDVWEQVLIRKGLIDTKPKPSEPQGELIQNAVQCLECDKIISSTHRHDYVVCGCINNTMVDGGAAYLRRGYNDSSKVLELALYTDSPDIEDKLLWGTRGKDGDEPLTWVRIKDMTTDHLLAALENVPRMGKLYRKTMIITLRDRGFDYKGV